MKHKLESRFLGKVTNINNLRYADDTTQMVTAAMKLKDACSLKEKL